MRFEAKRFLTDQFGTPHNVLGMFSHYGMTPPTLPAVEKWYVRRSIPGDWLALLLCMLEYDRGGFSLGEYLTWEEVDHAPA